MIWFTTIVLILSLLVLLFFKSRKMSQTLERFGFATRQLMIETFNRAKKEEKNFDENCTSDPILLVIEWNELNLLFSQNSEGSHRNPYVQKIINIICHISNSYIPLLFWIRNSRVYWSSSPSSYKSDSRPQCWRFHYCPFG